MSDAQRSCRAESTALHVYIFIVFFAFAVKVDSELLRRRSYPAEPHNAACERRTTLEDMVATNCVGLSLNGSVRRDAPAHFLDSNGIISTEEGPSCGALSGAVRGSLPFSGALPERTGARSGLAHKHAGEGE
ncbi:hypothetical protein C8R47DRAFT_1225941 [Mycena vitilis]|nr:hypothetical protein C8R47DRAFT_1225941 [Mycena vitilis]